MQSDTSIVHQSSWIAGAIQHLALPHNQIQQILHIDKALPKDVSSWVTKNSDSKLYIGNKSLSKDFQK